MTTPPLIFITDERMCAHENAPGHPERGDRLRALFTLRDERELAGAEWRSPTPAPESALRAVHTDDHVDFVLSLRGRSLRLDGDTGVCPKSVECALLSAGAAIDAVNVVSEGVAPIGYALGRPPGHHAEADRAMGFCLFNNIAIAAEHAISSLGLRRVLIVDFDVHHGNGTQHIFEERDDVWLFSVHEFPMFPGTGAASEVGSGPGLGTTMNVALPAGCGDDDYLTVFDELLPGFAERCRPELILVSTGYDAHANDPLASMQASTALFRAIGARVRNLATEHTNGRLALTLEGGYELAELRGSALEFCRGLLGRGDHAVPRPSATSGPVRRAIEASRHAHEGAR